MGNDLEEEAARTKMKVTKLTGSFVENNADDKVEREFILKDLKKIPGCGSMNFATEKPDYSKETCSAKIYAVKLKTISTVYPEQKRYVTLKDKMSQFNNEYMTLQVSNKKSTCATASADSTYECDPSKHFPIALTSCPSDADKQLFLDCVKQVTGASAATLDDIECEQIVLECDLLVEKDTIYGRHLEKTHFVQANSLRKNTASAGLVNTYVFTSLPQLPKSKKLNYQNSTTWKRATGALTAGNGITNYDGLSINAQIIESRVAIFGLALKACMDDYQYKAIKNWMDQLHGVDIEGSTPYKIKLIYELIDKLIAPNHLVTSEMELYGKHMNIFKDVSFRASIIEAIDLQTKTFGNRPMEILCDDGVKRKWSLSVAFRSYLLIAHTVNIPASCSQLRTFFLKHLNEQIAYTKDETSWLLEKMDEEAAQKGLTDEFRTGLNPRVNELEVNSANGKNTKDKKDNKDKPLKVTEFSEALAFMKSLNPKPHENWIDLGEPTAKWSADKKVCRICIRAKCLGLASNPAKTPAEETARKAQCTRDMLVSLNDMKIRWDKIKKKKAAKETKENASITVSRPPPSEEEKHLFRNYTKKPMTVSVPAGVSEGNIDVDMAEIKEVIPMSLYAGEMFDPTDLAALYQANFEAAPSEEIILKDLPPMPAGYEHLIQDYVDTKTTPVAELTVQTKQGETFFKTNAYNSDSESSESSEAPASDHWSDESWAEEEMCAQYMRSEQESPTESAIILKPLTNKCSKANCKEAFHSKGKRDQHEKSAHREDAFIPEYKLNEKQIIKTESKETDKLIIDNQVKSDQKQDQIILNQVKSEQRQIEQGNDINKIKKDQIEQSNEISKIKNDEKIKQAKESLVNEKIIEGQEVIKAQNYQIIDGNNKIITLDNAILEGQKKLNLQNEQLLKQDRSGNVPVPPQVPGYAKQAWTFLKIQVEKVPWAEWTVDWIAHTEEDPEPEQKDEKDPKRTKKRRPRVVYSPGFKVNWLAAMGLLITLFGCYASASAVEMKNNAPMDVKRHFNEGTELSTHRNSLFEQMESHLNNSMTVTYYQARKISVSKLIYNIGDITDLAFSHIDLAVKTIQAADTLCTEEENTCPHSLATINGLKATISNSVLVLNTVNRHCGLTHIPSTNDIMERALNHVDWRHFDPRTETIDSFGIVHHKLVGKLSRFMDLFQYRKKRGTRGNVTTTLRKKRWIKQAMVAVGLLTSSVGTVLGSSEIAKSEAHKITSLLRSEINTVQINTLDNIKKVYEKVRALGKVDDRQDTQLQMTAIQGQLLAETSGLVDLTGHLFTQDTSWSQFDPATEDIARTIDTQMRHNVHGYPAHVFEDIFSLLAGTTTIVTTMNGKDGEHLMCKDAEVYKFIIIPILDMHTKATYTMSSNGLWNDTLSGEERFISKNSIFSDTTTLRGQEIRVIGRTCTIQKGITVESGSTSNYLYEMITIYTEQDFNATETCKDDNARLVSKVWLITNSTIIRLPITCTLESEYLFCGYLNIVGNQEEHVPISPARMELVRNHHAIEEMTEIEDDEWETVTLNTTKETGWTLPSWNFPVIGGSSGGIVGIIILLGIAAIFYKKCKNQTGNQVQDSANNGKVNINLNIGGAVAKQANIYPPIDHLREADLEMQEASAPKSEDKPNSRLEIQEVEAQWVEPVFGVEGYSQ